MNATVKDVMTTQVVSIGVDATFKEIASMFRAHRVSAFPVTDNDQIVVGVVSEADLLPREALLTATGGQPGPLAALFHHKEHEKAAAVTAADLMTRPPITVTADEPVTAAARLMYSCKVKRLPVVDHANRLVGIVSRSDVLTVYSRPDEDIKHEVTERVILHEFLTDPGRFTVTVKDGIVTLEGSPETFDSGQSIVGECWHVEGVVAVRDRLRYPPVPHSTGLGPLF